MTTCREIRGAISSYSYRGRSRQKEGVPSCSVRATPVLLSSYVERLIADLNAVVEEG